MPASHHILLYSSLPIVLLGDCILPASLLIELRWLRIAVELFLSDALVRDHLPQNALLAVITEITPSQPLLFIRLYL